jgi:hypothetical protein
VDKNKDYLICKKIKFYSVFDKDIFFEWVNKIECIDDVEYVGKDLFIEVACLDLHDHDLRDLIALFYRYKIEMKQLQMFLNKKNAEWFKDPLKYWYKKVFGFTKKSP